VALSAAVLLALSACSSSVTGAPEPATAATSSATATELETSESVDTEFTDSPTPGDGPIEPGSGTDLWFATYCLAASNVTQYYSTVDPTLPLADLQAQFVDTYTDIADAAEAGADVLRNSPEPDPALVGDAPALALERFTSLAGIFGCGAQTIEGLAPASVDELKSATQEIQQEAATTGPEVMAEVDPEVLKAAKNIPECAGVL